MQRRRGLQVHASACQDPPHGVGGSEGRGKLADTHGGGAKILRRNAVAEAPAFHGLLLLLLLLLFYFTADGAHSRVIICSQACPPTAPSDNARGSPGCARRYVSRPLQLPMCVGVPRTA